MDENSFSIVEGVVADERLFARAAKPLRERKKRPEEPAFSVVRGGSGKPVLARYVAPAVDAVDSVDVTELARFKQFVHDLENPTEDVPPVAAADDDALPAAAAAPLPSLVQHLNVKLKDAPPTVVFKKKKKRKKKKKPSKKTLERRVERKKRREDAKKKKNAPTYTQTR